MRVRGPAGLRRRRLGSAAHGPPPSTAAMAIGTFTSLTILLVLSLGACLALFEDQAGLMDWHQQYIGKVNHAIFHTQKAGRKRVVVATEENVIASLDLRRGEIFWRHVLGNEDIVDEIDIAMGKYVVTLSSGGGILRAWNLPDGQMIWEAILQGSLSSTALLLVPKIERENIILVFGKGCLHAVSSLDGDILWRSELPSKSLHIQHIFVPDGTNDIYLLGLGKSSELNIFHIDPKNGELLKHTVASVPADFFGKTSIITSNTLISTNGVGSVLFSASLTSKEITFHQTYISNIIPEFSGTATLVTQKFKGMFVIKTQTCISLISVRDGKDLSLVETINSPAAVSEGLFLSSGLQAIGIVNQQGNKIHLNVKVDNDFGNDLVKESIELDNQKGHVQKVFLNSYVRTDRSHGFRALIVTEDNSLMLLQQGEIVWTREEGLASIVDVTTSELPLEKDGVSVAEVEHNLVEWLQGHVLKLKGTLMLAGPEDMAAIQGMRLKNSEKNKMTRDHNGFRKLLIVVTKAGKVLALHTGDGRALWSLLLPSFRQSNSCQHPTLLKIYPWQVPHHHAMDSNPSVLIVGKCDVGSDVQGVLSFVDIYTGKELNSVRLSYSLQQIIPLPFTDTAEQKLHLLIDSEKRAHLYPRSSESLSILEKERSNIYWYLVDTEKDIIRGHVLGSNCVYGADDQYCFSTRELWSVVFPSETEKIITIATRKKNEVVHTQAKVIADQDVTYKYISKNVLFVATVTPKAAGSIGSASPEEAALLVYIIDTVSGRILHRVHHPGSQGPVNAICSENWVVYHYFNLRAHRYQMSVIEIYDQSRADNKDVGKLVLGKHNLTLPVSAYYRPEVVPKSQTYFFSHSIKALAVTSTAKGITSKQILIGTIGDQVLALDKRYLDPRRSANPTAAEKEEGIVPLTDSLPIIPQSYVTHSLQVEGLRDIVTIPAKLESTSLVFAYGLDLFFTRIAPSRTYDSLTEDFSYALLLITIIALVVAILVTWVLSEKKELRDKWR